MAISSYDLLWSWPERKPIISPNPEGYGMMFAFPELVPLDPETWGMMFIGQYDLHDWGERHDPGRPSEGRTWKRDRLVVLEAPMEGRELTLNFQTQKEGGWIKAEQVEPPSSLAAPARAIEGFGLEEADVLAGDELARVVTWRGSSDLSALRGRQVAIRLHMGRRRRLRWRYRVAPVNGVF